MLTNKLTIFPVTLYLLIDYTFTHIGLAANNVDVLHACPPTMNKNIQIIIYYITD